MVSTYQWYDKLPEDKVAYYNRTRMSIEFFSRKLGIAPQLIIADLKKHGYRYNASKHRFE